MKRASLPNQRTNALVWHLLFRTCTMHFLDVYHTIVLFEVGYTPCICRETRHHSITISDGKIWYFDIVHMAFLFFVLYMVGRLHVKNTMVKYGCRYGNHSVPCFLTIYGITFLALFVFCFMQHSQRSAELKQLSLTDQTLLCVSSVSSASHL